ncbi:hypothetical protein OK016_23440 [Vibrio chagasii]|nr:hypothetical protein [Vibrio chagasii]
MNEGWVDNDKVHLIGQSLGGIMSVMVVSLAKQAVIFTRILIPILNLTR